MPEKLHYTVTCDSADAEILYADINEIPFRWRYRLVEGLDHNIEEMTKNAAPFLLSGLDY